MRGSLWWLVSLTSLWACGGTVLVTPGGDAGSDGGSSSSSSSGGSSSSSSGGSSSSSSSSSGGSSSSGSSSGGVGRVPLNHRANDAQCATTPPTGSCTFGGSPGGGICSDDAQCADAGPNARCVPNGGGPAGCFCTYDACMHDGDCTGETCACHGSPYMGGAGNTCVPGNCHVDADCGPGGYCSPSYGTQGCGGLVGYYCHVPAADVCVDDSDCGGGNACSYSTTAGHWECQPEVACL